MNRKNIFFAFIPLVLIGTTLFSPLATSSSVVSLSVPAAAFHPSVSNRDIVYNYGNELYTIQSEPLDYIFVAPVYLPEGVVVQKIIFYFRDATSYDGVVSLYRTDKTLFGKQKMGEAWTFGSFPGGTDEYNYDSSIDFANVNNSSYGYYLEILMRDGIQVLNVTIEYSYQAFLPIIINSIFRKIL